MYWGCQGVASWELAAGSGLGLGCVKVAYGVLESGLGDGCVLKLPFIATLATLVRARRFIVRGASMEPVFRDGDCLLVDWRAYRMRAPVRGEAVVLRVPLDEQAYLKRIVGLPGEWVRLEAGGVLVDGIPLDEPYLAAAGIPEEFVGQEWHLGPEDYLVLGDTRSDSFDSRRFGPVGAEWLVGPVLLRYWPLSRWGRSSNSA